MQREEACLEGQGPEPSLEKKPLPSLPMTRAQCSHQRERTPTTHPRLVITTSPPPWGPRATPILHMRRDLRLHCRKWRKAVRCQPEGRAAPPMGTPSSVKSHPQRTAVRGGLRVTSPLVPPANTLDTCSRTVFGAGSKDLQGKTRSYTACQKLTLKRKGSIQVFTLDGQFLSLVNPWHLRLPAWPNLLGRWGKGRGPPEAGLSKSLTSASRTSPQTPLTRG